MHSGVHAPQGAGTIVHLFSGKLLRTRISGAAAPIPPLFVRFWLLVCLTRFSEGLLFLHFAFRSLCFAGCGNSCSPVCGRVSPQQDLGGSRPHTPAFCEVRALNRTHSFQRRPPFSALCIPETMLHRVREQLSTCFRESFPAPGCWGLPPQYPASCEIRDLNLFFLFQQGRPFFSVCILESLLRRVRKQLPFCFRESFPAPGSRGLPPPYPRFL